MHLAVSLIVLGLVTTINCTSNSSRVSIVQQIREKLGHVLYKAAYDVLASESSDSDGHVGRPHEHHNLLASTLDFLSNVASTADELDDSSEERLLRRTNRAKRTPGTPPFADVPQLGVDQEHFMHEYVSRTGVGNREEIEVTRVAEEPIAATFLSTPKAWRYARFNSTNFVMAHQRSHVLVWPINLMSSTMNANSFNFIPPTAICKIASGYEGEIIRSEFYMKRGENFESLRIAVILSSPGADYQLRSYEVTSSGCIPVHMIELGRARPVSLRFVSSHYESSIVVLTEGRNLEPRFEFSQGARESSTRLIKISMRGAVDLETFAINGYSYLAVGHGTGVEIVRLNEFLNHQMLFDSLKMPSGVVDIVTFRMGFDNFLGVATRGVNQHLFEFREGSFHLKQTFAIGRVSQLLPIDVPSCRDDVLLSVVRADRFSPLLIFAWNGQSRQFDLVVSNIRKHTPHAFEVAPFTATSFPSNHSAFILELDTSGRPRVLSVHTSLAAVSDPVFIHTVHVTDFMKNLRERLLFQEDFIRRISEVIKFAVKGSANGPLRTVRSFRDLTASGDAIVNKITDLKRVFFQNSPITINDLRFRVSDLQMRMGEISSMFRDLELQLNNVAVSNQPTRMRGRTVFLGKVESNFVVNVTNLDVEAIRGQSVSRVLSQTFFRSSPTVIHGQKSLPSLVAGSVNAPVNGVDIASEAVMKHKPQTITSPMALNSLRVLGDASLQDQVNGIDFSSDLVSLNGGFHGLKSPIHFANAVTTIKELTSTTLDGIALEQFTRTVLMSEGNQTLMGTHVVNRRLTSGTIKDNRLLNGIHIPTMAANSVRTDKYSVITGPKSFVAGNVHLRGDIEVRGRVAGLHIPNDILLASVPQTITELKHFIGHGHRFENNVTVDGYLDGLRLPKDIVTLTGTDTAPILNLRQGADVFTNFESLGLVDGVDIQGLNRTALKATENKLFKPVFNGPVVIEGNLEVSGLTDGIKLSGLAADAIYGDTREPVVIDSVKDFRAALSTPAIQTNILNGLPIEAIARTRGSEPISRLVFNKVAFNDTNVRNASINDVNLMELSLSRISLNNPGYIVGGKNFVGQLRITNFAAVEGTFAGLNPKIDFITKTGNQPVVGTKAFSNGLNVHGLAVDQHLVSHGLVGGLNISMINQRRLPLATDQIVKTPTTLLNSRARRVQSTRVNQIDLRRFVANILFKSGNQVITAPKNFTSRVQAFNSISSEHGVNGVSLRELDSLAVKTKGLNVVRAPFVFANNLRAEDVFSYGLLNDVNLNGLFADSILKKSPKMTVINGRTTLHTGLHVAGDINANTINGIHLPRNILLKNGNQTVHGKVTFGQRLRAARDVSLAQSVNGVKLSHFDRSVMRTNRVNVVRGSLQFDNHVHVAGDVQVKGLVDGVKLGHLAQNTFYKLYDQDVEGPKTMVAPTRFLQDILTNSLGPNILLDRMMSDIVLLNRPEPSVFYGPQNFSAPVKVAANLRQSGANGTQFNGPLNGINLNYMSATGCRLNMPCSLSGNKMFVDNTLITRSPLRIAKRVNGVHIPRDVLVLQQRFANSTSPQHLIGRRRMSNVAFMNNVDVNGLVNGLKLPALHSDTLHTYREQTVRGRKIFKGRFELESGAHVNGLNSIRDVHTEVVSSRKDQIILGDTVIVNPFEVDGNLEVRGSVDGVDVSYLAQNSLYRDVKTKFEGPVQLQRAVFERDLQVQGPVNNVPLNLLSKEVTQFKNTLAISDSLMKKVMTRQLRSTSDVFNVLERSSYKVDSFKLSQELEGAYGNRIEVQGTGMFALSELGPKAINSTVYSMRFNRATNLFERRHVSHNVPTTKRIYFNLAGNEFTIHRSSFNSDAQTVLKSGSKVIGNISAFVDDCHVMIYSDKTAVITTLVGVKGQANVYLLQRRSNGTKAEFFSFKNVAVINVGPSALRTVSFTVDGEIYVAVARSFKNSCSVTDSGSLIFKFFEEGSHFKLFQRINVGDSNNVAYYRHNDQHYLAFSESMDSDTTLEPQSIKIFRSRPSSSGCQFNLFQKLHFDNIADLSVFAFGPKNSPELLMAAVNRTTVQIWRQDGAVGFDESWSLRANGGQALQPMLVDGHLYLIVGQNRQCIGSMVIEAQIKGASLYPIELTTKWKGR